MKHPQDSPPHQLSRQGITSRKLTEAQVREIRRRYNVRRPTMRELAEEYGVSPRTILSVIHNEVYRDE